MTDSEVRPGDDHGPLSQSDWVDSALRAALNRVTPLLPREAGRFRPRCILVTGSAALGEAVGWQAESRQAETRQAESRQAETRQAETRQAESRQAQPRQAGDVPPRLVLSDLDLGLVTADRIPAAERARLGDLVREAGSASGSLPVEVTLGFYDAASWSRQDPTPGMVDARDHAIIAWGDAAWPLRLSVPRASRIPAWEAVRLVGNRAVELLIAAGPLSLPALRPRAWHALAKAVTGLWTARLILEGRYRTGWSARRDLLVNATEDAEPAAGNPLIRAARLWDPFLRQPGESTLPPPSAWLESYRAALRSWLQSMPPELRPPGAPLDCPFDRDSSSVRQRLRAWRAEQRRASGSPARPGGSLAGALAAFLPETRGTPDGRRMAAAIVYWLNLPERPEPLWGVSPIDAFDAGAWEKGVLRQVGRPVAAGPGCRARLAAMLGLDAAPAMGAREEQSG